MLTCPMCKKPLRGLDRQCPTCRADLSLLVEYVGGLEEGLARAASQTQAGELGEAVWSYLEILEVDPDNATARRQVALVAAAVRQFDRAAQGRRWLDRLRRKARFRQWAHSWGHEGSPPAWMAWLLWLVLATSLLILGFGLGYQTGRQGHTATATDENAGQ